MPNNDKTTDMEQSNIISISSASTASKVSTASGEGAVVDASALENKRNKQRQEWATDYWRFQRSGRFCLKG